MLLEDTQLSAACAIFLFQLLRNSIIKEVINLDTYSEINRNLGRTNPQIIAFNCSETELIIIPPFWLTDKL